MVLSWPMSDKKTSAHDLITCEQTLIDIIRKLRFLLIDQIEEVVGEFIDDETTTVQTIIERMKESDFLLDEGWHDLQNTFAIATPFVTVIKSCNTQNPELLTEISAMTQAYERVQELIDSLLDNQLIN